MTFAIWSREAVLLHCPLQSTRYSDGEDLLVIMVCRKHEVVCDGRSRSPPDALEDSTLKVEFSRMLLHRDILFQNPFDLGHRFRVND